MAFQMISKNYLNILMSQKFLHFLKFPSPSASLFSNNLALYMKDLKLLVLATSALKLVASSSE